MALLKKQLYIKKSKIPNAGKGLFTKKPIAKGTRIIEYTGRRTKWKDVKDEDGKNGYIFYINRNHVIDALPTTKAYARYANDARGLVRIKGMLNNSDYIVDGLKAYIESKKDIPAGGEILSRLWKGLLESNSRKYKTEKAGRKRSKAKAKWHCFNKEWCQASSACDGKTHET